MKITERRLIPAFTLVALLALALASPALGAATVTIVNADGPGEGFNDPTPVAPVTGNPGTTLGAQRLNVFLAAAAAWGEVLSSDVEIRVESRMNPLPCNAGSAVLGSAGPQTVDRDFSGAPMPATWYHQALANSLAGADLDPLDDITATFNSNIDNNNACLAGTDWWYGIGAPAPGGTIEFATTVLHEIGHGLGVSTFVNISNGAKLLGFDDCYMKNLEDHTTGLTWDAMATNGQRASSAINTGNLHWVGSNVLDASGFLTSGISGGHVRMYAPNPVQVGSSVSHFDTVLTPDELMEPFLRPSPLQILTNQLLKDCGWNIAEGAIFTDGFEGGNTSAWSDTMP